MKFKCYLLLLLWCIFIEAEYIKFAYNYKYGQQGSAQDFFKG